MDMSPMIDMVFLLLLFFLVVSNPKLIKLDPKVEVPIAEKAKPPEIKQGRIVINVRKDGTFADENGDLLSDDSAISEHFSKLKAQIDTTGFTPRLHLRGDKSAVFRYSRKVIRLAAAEGITDVIFASFIK